MALNRSPDFFRLLWLIFLFFFFFFVAFREEFTRISFVSVQCKKPPFTNTMFIDRSRFQGNSVKGYSRKISMRLFQNLTNSFRKDFFMVLFMFIWSSSPHSPEPCSWTDQNFTNIFERGHFRNISENWELEATYSVVLIDLVLLLN